MSNSYAGSAATPLHVREITRDNLLGYVPSIPLNLAGAIVFGLIALAQTFLYSRYKARYMLTMIFGAWYYTAGVVVRFPLRSHTDSIGLLVVQAIFIICSPCGFIATCYFILGQLGLRLDGDYLPVRPARIAEVFIWSDIITFHLQSLGAALTLRISLAEVGKDILLAALLLQAVSFLVFCAFYTTFLLRLRARQPMTFSTGSWRPLGAALAVACVALVVRSVYRCIENAQGINGFLALHEVYFWALDALPCAISIGVFVVCWPELHLPPPRASDELSSTSAAPLTVSGYIYRGLRLMVGMRSPAAPRGHRATVPEVNPQVADGYELIVKEEGVQAV